MSTVYVLNKDGKPLMPTTRGEHVRHLLKEQKARVVRTKPFTIQLLYETDDVVQLLYLGIDPGRTNIGVAVVKTDGTAVFTAHADGYYDTNGNSYSSGECKFVAKNEGIVFA